MQCLFSGKTRDHLTDIQAETYNGLFVVNNGFYYTQPQTIESAGYVQYRTSLITEGVCKLRDRAIRGEISQEEFWSGYKALKEKGLNQIITDGDMYYQSMMSGGVGE